MRRPFELAIVVACVGWSAIVLARGCVVVAVRPACRAAGTTLQRPDTVDRCVRPLLLGNDDLSLPGVEVWLWSSPPVGDVWFVRECYLAARAPAAVLVPDLLLLHGVAS